MIFQRKRTWAEVPHPSRFDKLSQADLTACVEAEMTRTGELFRGLSHSELDQMWVLSEMETHTETALAAIRAMKRKVAVVQSI